MKPENARILKLPPFPGRAEVAEKRGGPLGTPLPGPLLTPSSRGEGIASEQRRRYCQDAPLGNLKALREKISRRAHLDTATRDKAHEPQRDSRSCEPGAALRTSPDRESGAPVAVSGCASKARRTAIWIALFLLAFSVPRARAENPDAAFDAANKLYEQGKYSEAANTYEKLIQSGPASAALYFNLGNALFKSGQIGRAVAAYRQAQQLSPHDPDARANLQFARSQTQSPTLVPNYSQRVLRALSLNEWTLLAASAVWILFLLLAFLQWRPALKRSFRGSVLGSAVAAVILCCGLGAAFYEHRFTRTAVVIARDTVVHNGPLEESQNVFTVHDGAELRVLDQKDEWLQVSTDPRRIGWVRRDQVLFLPRG